MSVSYATGRKPRAPRRARFLMDPEVRAERDRLLHLPTCMHAGKAPYLYPEEFRLDEAAEPPTDWRVVEVIKGHSPHTREDYHYMVKIFLEPGIHPSLSRFCPVSISRINSQPRRWVNQLGEGLIEPPEDGLHLIWAVNIKARSERMSSIIAKAKVRLAHMLGHIATRPVSDE